jgi:hypothetical protein
VSELLCDWGFTVNQFVLATSPLRLATSNLIFQTNTCGHSPYVTSSLMRGWVCRLKLVLALASAVILRSESHGTRPHFTVSDSRLLQPEGYTLGTGFPFRRLLRLAGLLWRTAYKTALTAVPLMYAYLLARILV